MSKHLCPHPGCGRTFRKPQGLGSHMRTHDTSGKSPKPGRPRKKGKYVCKDCGADFGRGKALGGRGALGGFVGYAFEQAFRREDEEESDHCGDRHRERVRPPLADQRPLLDRRCRGGGLNCTKRQGQIVRR